MLLFENLPPLCFIPTVKMTSILSCKRPYKKCTSKGPLKSLLFSKSSYDKPLIDLFIDNLIVNLFGFSVAKYTKENLQKIFKTILKACDLTFNRSYGKLLKAKSPNVYYGKSYI